MTIKDVAEHMEMNWKTVKSIDKHYIKEQIESLRNLNPERIGVDEIAYRKGHNYLTVVRDLDLEAVIWVGFNRRKETLDEFFHLLGKEKRREISVVVTDMHKPYLASINENCPQADVVIDKFHIIKMINEALDEIRKKAFAKADESIRKKMKRMRFVILRRLRRLNDKQRENLYEMMSYNDELFQAYLLKEHVSDIFDELDPVEALERLNGWAINVMHSGLKPFIEALGTIKRHVRGIVNYFKHQVTNAQSEGFNTKINIIRRKAYGFWDLEYFMLKIHQACGVMKLEGIQNGR
jgi:transposase